MDISQIKCYFPDNTNNCSNVKISNKIIENIKQLLSTYRIDIKNYGNEENTIEVTAENCKISAPAWYKDSQGQGFTVEGTNNKQKIIIKAINNGKLRLLFKGQDKRCNGQRIPIWTDYKSIKIDGKEVLSEPIATWHDKPYIYEHSVKNKQDIVIEFETNNHQYPKDYLKDTILKLECDNVYITNNIDAIIKNLGENKENTYLESYPHIEADYFISLGKNCKEAFWLKQYGLRIISLPFDWMVNYNLSFVINTLKNGIEVWCNKWCENENYDGKFRQIQDLDSGMLIQHFFPREVTVIEYMNEFKQLFKRRIERFREIIQNGKIICFLCDRDEIASSRIEFLETLHKLYPLTKFIMINIIHSPENRKIYRYQISSNILLYEVYANNYHENSSKYKNDGWIGNEKLWNEICRNLSLSDNTKKQREKDI